MLLLAIILNSQLQAELERADGIFCGSFAAGGAIVDLPSGAIMIAGSWFQGPSVWPQDDEYWSVLSKASSTPGDYRVKYLSPRRDMVALDAGNVLGGPELELVLVLASGEVEIHDPVSRELLASFAGTTQPLGLEIGNADADAEEEILIVSATACAAFDGAGIKAWETTLLSGTDVVVGQMDADPSFEVAALNGVVLDVTTLTAQWTLAEEPMDLDVGDFDRDGVSELVVLLRRLSGAPVQIWDVDAGVMKTQLFYPSWSFHYGAVCVRAADLDHDGVPEVIAGFTPRPPVDAPNLVIWDARANLVLQDFRSFVTTPEEILVANLDEDSRLELLLLGEGAQILDPSAIPATVEWQNPGLKNFLVGPVVADLEGDGIPEVVVSGSKFGATELFLAAHDAEDLSFRFLSEPARGLRSAGPFALEAWDLDGNGRDEVALAGAQRPNRGFALIFAWNPVTGILEQTWSAGSNHYTPPGLSCLEAVDLNRDGAVEICAGESASGYHRPLVHVFEYPSGRQLFEFSGMGPINRGSITDLDSGDLDGDGYPELLVLVREHGLFVFDHSSVLPRARLLRPFTSMDLAKRGGEMIALLSSADGSLSAYRLIGGASLVLVGTTSPLIHAVNDMAVGPAGHLWVRAEALLHLVQPAADRITWISEDYGWNQYLPHLSLHADPLYKERCLLVSPYALLGYRAR